LTTQHWTQNFCKENLLLTYLLAHFFLDVALYPWTETKIMFAHTSGVFLTLCFCSGPCLGPPPTAIAEALDQKWLREGMNQTGHERTHSSGREWQNTYREGQKADDQLEKFYFSQQVLYKRGRDLNIKNTLTYLQLFSFCHPIFLLPVSLAKCKLLFSQGKPFSIPSHPDRSMVHLQIPTLSECC
jgi:hypothetical protein